MLYFERLTMKLKTILENLYWSRNIDGALYCLFKIKNHEYKLFLQKNLMMHLKLVLFIMIEKMTKI